MAGISGEQTDPTQADDQVQSSGTNDPGTQDVPEGTGDGQEPKITEQQEKELVKQFFKIWTDARKFDENFRKQVAIDRRYAAGTSDLSWAVTTNVIGAFIDILVDILYARDPAVSVRKTEQVDEAGSAQDEAFAKTLELVITYLWRKGKLKAYARKAVRAAMSVGEGWLKCTMIAEENARPVIKKALNDLRETLERLQAEEKKLEDNSYAGNPDAKEAMLAEKQALIEELDKKTELTINRMFVIDFVRTENIQVSTDVDSISSYLDADWMGDESYWPETKVLAMFPRLTCDDLKKAVKYYQSKPKELTTRDLDNVLPQGTLTAADAEGYTTSTSQEATPCLYRVVEMWGRVDKHVRTMIDGVEKFAKEPYIPAYPTQRFYPYFGLMFFEVDGQRHSQSLSWRLYKLQDEYSCTRSNFRLSRERAIPATIFDATAMDDTEARKLQEAKHQEYVGIRPTNPGAGMQNVFAPKPVSAIDPRLYDTTPILNDFERMSGVAEALQSARTPGTPQTATEANQQQAGTNARTTADRDMLEWMLTDMAQATAEQALQCYTARDAQRVAGSAAFWPQGMDIDDLYTWVNIEIEAGSTGKPKQQTDQAAWGVVLPLLEKLIGSIEQARVGNNQPLANALSELVKETMQRMGDNTDVTRFIPQAPPPGSPGAGAKPTPPPPEVKISLTGQLSPATASAIAAPTVALDQSITPPPAPPGGAPGGGGSPAGPVAPTQAPAPGLAPAAAGP